MTNTFGKKFTITTCGESHGAGYMCIIDGCPAGLALTVEDIQKELDLRKPGTTKLTSQRREGDQVEIISGLFEGKTTGTPIGLLVRNTEQRSSDYDDLKDVFRPGHADYTYQKKYGIRDHRGGGRASARETLNWVAAGAIAKKYLAEKYDIEIKAHLSEVGDLVLNQDQTKEQSAALEKLIDQLRKDGDSIGAKVHVEAFNVPVGFGEPVFNKLDAELAKAFMSINAVKGVEIGDGFAVVNQKGSEHRDEITPDGFLSNHAGGVLGGISTGQTITANIAIKPASSIRIPGKSVDINNKPVEVITKGRHDPCVGIRAVPVVETMMALVLMDFTLLSLRGTE